MKKIEQLNKFSRLNGDPHQKIHTLEPVHDLIWKNDFADKIKLIISKWDHRRLRWAHQRLKNTLLREEDREKSQVKEEAEIKVMLPQGKEPWSHQKAETSGDSFPLSLQNERDPDNTSFWIEGSRNLKE